MVILDNRENTITNSNENITNHNTTSIEHEFYG